MAGRIAYYGNIVTDGLVLNLDAARKDSYNRTGTTWNDISGNGNNGTLTNGPTFDSEDYGSIVFDGVDDYVNIPNSTQFSFGNGTSDLPFSIFSWINMVTATDFVTISKDSTNNREWVIRFFQTRFRAYFIDNSTGGYIGRFDDTQLASSYVNQWIYFGFTYNGDSTSAGIKLYLNSDRIDNANYQGGTYVAMETLSAPVQIAAQGGFIASSNGKISNTTIYNRALTQEEITQNFNALRGRYGI